MLKELLNRKVFPSPLILEGKETESLILQFVQTALCDFETACGTCRSCKQVIKGFHPDWIASSGSIKMEELREKLRQLHQKAFQAKRKVLSFTDLQDANKNVQNALLKTLEEPHLAWSIIGGVNSRFGLLPTVRSRCLIYRVADPIVGDSLFPNELELFELIGKREELFIQKNLETVLKERNKAKSVFQKLLNWASHQGYPGHWEKLAPVLEENLWALDRNLNPRILWDTVWAKSFASEF